MVGHRGLSRPLEELTTPWDRSRLSCKSPQTLQDFRLQRFGLRNSLSAPAQSENITQGLPTAQPCPTCQAAKGSGNAAKH